MYMADGIDTGDILDVATVTLEEKETGGSLFDKLAQKGAGLILTTLENLEKGTAVRKKQDDSKASYAGKITKELGEVDFTKPADEIERLIRGLNPWPGTFTYMNGKMLKIWDADVVPGEGKEPPGYITEVNKNYIKVAAGQGYLKLREIQLEGKKRMKVSDFLNGYHVTADQLGK